MKITYEIVTQEDAKAVVTITPDASINGFDGVTIGIQKNETDGENWIEERVKWKCAQQIGEPYANCTVVKA